MPVLSSSTFLHKTPQKYSLPSIENTKKTKLARPNHTPCQSFFSPCSLKKLIHHAKKLSLHNPLFIIPQEPIPQFAPKVSPPSLHTLLDLLDDFALGLDRSPLPPSLDPKQVLSGNFSPVDELPPTACTVLAGPIPDCLHGAYIRNGPNPQFAPRGPYHLFDGDGMLHAITISRDGATFCSRYVKTYKYSIERQIGRSIFPSIFSSFNSMGPASTARALLTLGRVLARQFDPVAHGFGSANISVALIGGRLFALGEADLPYEIKVTRDGDIVTLGRHGFYADKPFSSMTAHPKVDPKTGETFAFRFHVLHPHLTLFAIDAIGKKQRDLPIFSMRGMSLSHDFAVTKNYVVFPDTQIELDLTKIMRGGPPVRVDPGKIPRVGIIPKNSRDESGVLWIEAPGFNMMHCVNAWEEDEGEVIVMVASNTTSVEKVLERLDLARPMLEKVTINVKTKTLERHSLSDQFMELGVINPKYAGQKNRYAYAGIVGEPMKLIGVTKLDISTPKTAAPTVVSRLFGPGCSVSEPFFVAMEPDNPAADEDDGYLIAYIHDDRSQESKFFVMDAKSPTLEVTAAVKLPGRVPMGFHGLFVRESDL